MIRSARTIHGHKVHAADGDIGKATDFLFDDQTWTVRYLVVDTGGWLSGRSVLISPLSINNIDWEGKRIDLVLSRARVENSPGIDAHLPVSRQMEAEYYRYYGWPYYWAGGGLWGPTATPGASAAFANATYPPPPPGPDQGEGDPHLRSTQAIIGYRIHASDGELGNVEDFLLDDETWSIHQLVIDTTRWLPGGEVVIPPGQIKQVDWISRSVFLGMDRDAIKHSPEFDERDPPSG
jgi:sporulation protein YlmC with PRC-barrel domain